MITLLKIGTILWVVLFSYLIIRKLFTPKDPFWAIWHNMTYFVYTTDEKLIGKKIKKRIGGRNGLITTTYYKRKPESVQRMESYFMKNPVTVPVTAEQHENEKTMNKIRAELKSIPEKE